MKVPILNGSRVNPSGQPNVQIQNAQTPQALLGASPARALADFGEIASGATALYKQQWDEENQIRVQDSVNKVAQLEQSAELDQKNGFRARRGSDVVGFKDEDGNDFINHYTNTIRKEAKEIEESLSNPIQRKMFQQRIAGRETAFNGRVQAYFLDQNNDYKAQVAQTTLETNATSLAMSYGDNATTQQSLDGIASAVGTMGKLKGWDAATTTNETLKLGSKAVLGAIDKMQSDGKTTDIPSYMQQFGKYLTPADQDKVNELMQKNRVDLAQGIILNAKQTNDRAAITTLSEQLNSEQATKSFSVAQINSLKSSVIAAENHFKQQDARIILQGEQAAKTLEDQIKFGRPLDASVFEKARSAAQGTPSATVVGELEALYPEILKFKNKPVAEQEAFITNLQIGLNNASTDDAARDQRRYNMFKSTYNDSVKLANENPAAYLANKAGNTLQAIDTSNLTTPDGIAQMAEIATDRLATIRAERKTDPSLPLNPFSPREIKGIKSKFAEMNADTKLNVLSQLARTAKGANYGAIVGAIAGDDRILRIAGIAQFRNLRGTEGTEVAQTLLKGQEVLKSKATILPSDNELLVNFNDYVGNAVTGQARQDAYQAYKALHAGLAFDKGVNYKSTDSSVDESLSNTALSLATGGIYDQGKKQGYKNWKVSMPYGWDDEKFEDALESKMPALANQGVALSVLEDLPLLQVPGKEGQYYFLDGMRPVLNDKGMPIILGVK